MSVAIKSWLGIPFLVFGALVLSDCGGDPFEAATGLDSGADAGADVAEDAVHDVTADTDDTGDGVSSDTSQDAIHDTSQDTSPDTTDDVTVVESLELTPLEHTFSADQGETSDPFKFEVTNTGTAKTGAVEIEVLNPAFGVEHDCGTLESGSTCEVTVKFSPTAQGLVSSPILVTAIPGGSASAALLGHTPVLSNGLAIDPPVFDFGAIDHGSWVVQDFTISNVGSADLSGLTFEVTAPPGIVFTLSDHSCQGSLALGQECTVSVQYEPLASEPGRKTAELHAQATGAEASAFLLGHTPDVFVRTGGNDSADGLSPPSAVETIGKGLQRAKPEWTVRLLGGTYATESFPLVVDDVTLLGMNGGGGPPTIAANSSPKNLLVLEGANPVLRNLIVRANAQATVDDSTVVLGRPTTKAILQDVVLHMADKWTGIDTDATAAVPFDILSSDVVCSNTGADAVGIAVYGAAKVFLDKSKIDHCDIGMTVDGNASVKIRESMFLDNQQSGVTVTSHLAQVDLGVHQGEAGGNTFKSALPAYVALNVRVAVTVNASGNLWIPSVQEADAAGHYLAGSQQDGPLLPPATSGPNNLWLQHGGSVVNF